MRHNYYKMIPVVITSVMLFSGCSTSTIAQTSGQTTESTVIAQVNQNTDSLETTEESFSDRDLSGDFDETEAIKITLDGDKISASSDGVTISGSTVTITKEGTYILSGSLDNGSVIINTSKEENVQLVLDGVSITSDSFAPIYVAQADKVFVTLAENTENTLTNGGSFSQIDDNNVDAVIFSKDDLTLNGNGLLTIQSPAGKGIVAKDELVIASGSYDINASETCIRANDSIAVADGTFKLTTKADGIHVENKEDDSLGNVYIKDGTFTISADSDGIQATTTLQIDGGSFDISSAEGLEATCIIVNDGEISIKASDDGINAAQKSSTSGTPTVEINGGNITIVMGEGDTDGVDANGNIVINGGTVNVTGNSTFDYDGTGTINGGTVIANGEEITTLPNQTMGGHDGMGGHGGHGGNGRPGGFNKNGSSGNDFGGNGSSGSDSSGDGGSSDETNSPDSSV